MECFNQTLLINTSSWSHSFFLSLFIFELIYLFIYKVINNEWVSMETHQGA